MARDDRLGRLSDSELERALKETGERIEYPVAPDVASYVAHRLREERPGSRQLTLFGIPLGISLGRSFSARWRVAASAVAVLLLACGVVLGVSPSARSSVAHWLGLKGIVIVREPSSANSTTPRAKTNPDSSARRGQSGTTGDGLKLGERMPMRQARRRVGYRVLVPTLPELGSPDRVYWRGFPPGGQVSLVYRARSGIPRADATGAGVLFTEFRGSVQPFYFEKVLGPGTRLEKVRVNGGRGYWIEGKPYTLVYEDRMGKPLNENTRLAGNTLLWEQGDLTLRIEGALSKEQGMKIAESVR